MAVKAAVAIFNGIIGAKRGVNTLPGPNPGPPADPEAQRRATAAADADLEARYAALKREPPAPEIRDAELRLAAAMGTYAEIIAATAALTVRIGEATAPVRRLESARADAQLALDAALADLARLDAAEAEAVIAWAESGDGDKPAPQAAQRRRLDDAAAHARRTLAHIDAALGEKQAALGAVGREGAALGQQRDRAVIAVLYETGEVIGARYAAALSEAARHAAELEGLNHALGGLRGRDLALADGTATTRPAITDDTAGFVREQRVTAKAYWLRGHRFGRFGDLCAVASVAEIKEAAMRWAEHINRLVGMSQGADAGALGERAALIAENAALAAQLAAADDTVHSEETESCS